MDDRVNTDIARLHMEQTRVKAERKRVANELRNTQKRKQRLKHRARLLSSEDLMTVIAMRETDTAMRCAVEGVENVEAGDPIETVAIGTTAGSDPGRQDGSDIEE